MEEVPNGQDQALVIKNLILFNLLLAPTSYNDIFDMLVGKIVLIYCIYEYYKEYCQKGKKAE